MRNARLGSNDTGSRTDNLHVQFQEGQMLSHMFKAPDRNKRRIGCCKNIVSIHRKPCGNANHVLFGNANIQELVRKRLPIPIHSRKYRKVCRQKFDIFLSLLIGSIIFSKFLQTFPVFLSIKISSPVSSSFLLIIILF